MPKSETNSIDVDRLPCAVIEVSQSRQVLACNKHAGELFSDLAGTVVGQRVDELLTAASRIFIDSYVYPLLLQDSKAEEIQLNLKVHTGQKLPVVANIRLEENKTSIWTFMVCESRNKLYEELLSTRDSLSEQAGELKALNEQIHKDRDDLQVFCRSLSHDFTGPIRRIQQSIDFATEDLRARGLAVDDELLLLEHTSGSAATLMRLVQGLIEYLTADADVRQNEMVDLNEMVASAIELSTGSEGGPLNISVDPLPTVPGSASQLQVLFKNLLGNALKYTENTPEIAISCDNVSREGYSIIAIEDNGIGISAEYLERIFKPFSRLHREEEFDGSGLGLSIVQKLVANHGGDVTVTSVLGKGSTFYVGLPKAPTVLTPNGQT